MNRIEIENGTRVTMVGRELVFGETIFAPRDSNNLLEEATALKQRLTMMVT